MALPSIIFQEGQGGLGRPLTSNDHISGLLFYTNGTLPSGFATTSVATRCKALYSADDAVTAGILKDYSDATAAQGVYTVTGIGANGDTLELKVADIATATGATQSTSLGVYTKTASETTVSLIAAAYVVIINAGTATHGYTASNISGAITIVAPKRLGAYLNGTTPLTATISGTITGTITSQVGTSVAGVASRFVQYYYQIEEFFRLNPKGKLWVGFFAVPSPYTFSEITDMQTNAAGEIRQIGVLKDSAAWAVGDLTACNTIATTLKGLYQPIHVIYAGDLQATTDITTVTDLSSLALNQVSTCIGQDGGGWGNFLYKMNGTSGKKSITCLGAQLGTVSARKVSESIAWVEKCNQSNGSELETPAFCNGQLVSALAASALESINTKRHIFLKKFTGYSGSFYNDSHCAVISTSDYAYIENNRTICKAERLLYAAYLPNLNSPITFNTDGTMTDATVAYFENIGSGALDQMVRDGELSAKLVTINPSQDVLATSILIVAVVLVINGVARTIQINIGFKPSIS